MDHKTIVLEDEDKGIYEGFGIKVLKKESFLNETSQGIWYEWQLFKDGKFCMRDWRTVDGGMDLGNLGQAYNDARKNVDVLRRLKMN